MKLMTAFMKKGVEQIDELVMYLNQLGHEIKADEVECIGAMSHRDAVMWNWVYYLVYTDSTKTTVRNIDALANKINAKYSELDWGRTGG